MKVIKEHFTSIHQLLKTLDSRRNNDVMRGEDSSNTSDYDFTRTRSYKEATTLFEKGYTDILPKIREGMKKMERKLATEFIHIKKIYPETQVQGFIPHVPNSIINLPHSMINIERIPQKQKTLNIFYEMGANCWQDPQLFIDAGIVLLTAIKILELNRISVKLTLGFMAGIGNNQSTFPTVDIKNYGQRIDLQKLCFPLAHPSMFRRIGFKWLETTPDLTDTRFQCGYGRSPADNSSEWKDFVKKLDLKDNVKILRAQDIRDMNFDVKKLLASFNINRYAKSKKTESR